MARRLMEGSEAMAEAAIACGCRFFAGYPMTPFTELLEHFAKKLPEVGGVCVNAESELEAVGPQKGFRITAAGRTELDTWLRTPPDTATPPATSWSSRCSSRCGSPMSTSARWSRRTDASSSR